MRPGSSVVTVCRSGLSVTTPTFTGPRAAGCCAPLSVQAQASASTASAAAPASPRMPRRGARSGGTEEGGVEEGGFAEDGWLQGLGSGFIVQAQTGKGRGMPNGRNGGGARDFL